MNENNNKLFVFERKEVFLIFLFILIIAITAFTLGVRVGKKLSLANDGFTGQDIQNINLKSVEEEFVNDTYKEKLEPNKFQDSMGDTSKNKPVELQDSMEEKLKAEMQKLASSKVEVEKPVEKSVEMPTIETEIKDDTYTPGSEYTGKYSIQLYSNQSRESAQDFADGFIVKGYDVIINEVTIPGKGKWYRVSIGAFDNINEAKDYLQKEKSLFQSNKYIIKRL